MYIPSFVVSSEIAFRLMRLLSIYVSLVLRCVASLSTWQRSRSAVKIQGDWQQKDTLFLDMETKEDDKRVPSFDGRLDQYRDYRKRALLYFHGLEDSKQTLAAPRLIANLSGSAFECFREKDPGAFRNASGVINMLAILDSRFQFTPEQELSDWMENLLYKMRRKRGEETTAYTTRFETTLAKVEDLITTELKLERRRQHDFQRAEFRRASLDYMVALQAHQAAVASLPEGATPPEPPVGPAAPEEPPAVEHFQFPEVIKGFLYLRHVGISLQTRASLLRSSGGSLRYEKVAELLRKTELDAMVVGRAAGQPEQSSFLADGQDDDYDDDYDDDEWSEEDSAGEDFGGYAEDEETEGEDDGGDILEEDQDYDSAMLGYLEARQKLMALRKARGFKEPSDQGPEKKHGTFHRGKTPSGHREGYRDGKPRSSSSTGRSRDFQWKERNRTSSSSSHRRPRQKTPPPSRDRKAKGKGKGKPSGKRQGARKEPTGAHQCDWRLFESTEPHTLAIPATVQLHGRALRRSCRTGVWDQSRLCGYRLSRRLCQSVSCAG